METTAALAARLADLLRREHGSMADFLVALAEFDRRRCWAERGHASLFAYLHRELGLSTGSAYYRMTAARLLQTFPEVEPPLRDGRLCLSSVASLARVLTPENRADVLPRFFHCSKQEAKVVAAEIAPAAAVPSRDVVTAMPLAFSAEAASSSTAPPAGAPAHVRSDEAQPVSDGTPASIDTSPFRLDETPDRPLVAPAPEPLRDAVEPLTAELRRMHVTVTRRFLDKLAAAKEAVSNASPDAGTCDVLEAALDLLLERKARQRSHGAKPRKARRAEPTPTPTPSTSTPTETETESPAPRHVPAAVKRAVWRRDGGCCQWVLPGGAICGSRRRIQFDHRDPRARGGPATVENVRLLCRWHNDRAARLAFGDAWMDQFTHGGASPA